MSYDIINATNELQKCLGRWKQNATDPSYYHHEESRPKSADANKLEILKELCHKGADLDYLEGERGFACVTHVFWSKTLIQFLVDKGCNVNSRDENGDTALHLAIRHSNVMEIIYDPDQSSQSDSDDPDYQSHIFYPKKLVQIVKFLMKKSIDPSVTNLRGETANFTLAECELRNPRNDSNKKVAKILLAKEGATVEIRKSDGQIVLDCQSVIDQFIDAFDGGIEFRTSKWDYSQTLLMLAASVGRLDYCQRLVERGADINAVDLQGYTALHYAVLNSFWDCAEFLINKGADTTVKSASGKDIYDLSIYHNYDYDILFIHGLTPEKLFEKYEIAAAVQILKKRSLGRDIIELMEKAMDVSKRFSLQPSPEFVANYQYLFFRDNRNNGPGFDRVFDSAINTVVRLSEGPTKFWNLVSVVYLIHSECGGCTDKYFMALLKELEQVEDMASFDVADLKSLSLFVRFVNNRLQRLNDYYWESARKVDMASGRISRTHSYANLAITCFNKLLNLTGSNRVSDDCMETYVKVAIILTSLHSRCDAISEKHNNEQLLMKLVDLDLRNKDGDTLMHRILGNEYSHDKISSDIVCTLIDFKFVNVKTKNARGFEPVQLINSRTWHYHHLPLKVLVKLAARGADIDARTSWDGETIRDVFQKEDKYLAFHYDNLQCASARMLARSLERYRDRVPKHMVEFIRMHMQ